MREQTGGLVGARQRTTLRNSALKVGDLQLLVREVNARVCSNAPLVRARRPCSRAKIKQSTATTVNPPVRLLHTRMLYSAVLRPLGDRYGSLALSRGYASVTL
jgi:hypothetical protein